MPPQHPDPLLWAQNRHMLRQLLLSNQLVKAIDELRVKAEQIRDAADQGYAAEHQLYLTERAKNSQSNLNKYITTCHNMVYSELDIAMDMPDGSIKSPVARFCPARIVPWRNLPVLQSAIFRDLDEPLRSSERLYESISFMEGLAERIMCHNVSSQDDLAHFQRVTTEEPLRYILYQLKDMACMTACYKLGDGVVLEHHCDSVQAETDPPRNPRPLGSEQVCVRRLDRGDPEPDMAYIIGCKTPAKLTMEQLHTVLHGTLDVSRIVSQPTPPADDEEESYRFHAEKLTVAALVEVFDSMIDNGLEYGVLTTGEIYVFLRIDWADVTTLHYDVAEPVAEVDQAAPEEAAYYSALGQLLAFTLLALGKPNENRAPRSQVERDAAKAQLQIWTLDWETAWREMPEVNKRGPPRVMSIPDADIPIRLVRTPSPSQVPGVRPRPPATPPRPLPAGFSIDEVRDRPANLCLSRHRCPPGRLTPTPSRERDRPSRDGSNGTGSSEAQMSSTPSHQDDGGASGSSAPASKKPRPCSQAPPSQNDAASTSRVPPAQSSITQVRPSQTRSASATQVPRQSHPGPSTQAPPPQQTQAPGSQPHAPQPAHVFPAQLYHVQPQLPQPAFVVDAQFTAFQPWFLFPLSRGPQQQPVPNNAQPQPQYVQGPFSGATGFNGSSSQMGSSSQTQTQHSHSHPPRTDGPPFCTQACLGGLIKSQAKGQALDVSCPNARLHQRNGSRTHAITLHECRNLLHAQLDGDVSDLDDGLVPITHQGGRGATFKLTLKGYGYTLVAKGVRPELVTELEREVDVPVGSCVPRFLGTIDLAEMDKKYHYGSETALVSLVLLTWSGDLGDPVDWRRI
ncbi:hypothetical protein MAPG_10559 [Magnaporthiopsis poae ATCC 64411]|uniref:Protein kinase domain-containing protein n=1 Tax=Magnaporthiopsis poae (strain ATCC 64411 / 73-15) TaxID=644358 RepID=A0A0C4ECX0_MAGP6|nr:hypothetical protein MAPG_10559 [Magnaporthiopsis poae ATCC 64411]